MAFGPAQCEALRQLDLGDHEVDDVFALLAEHEGAIHTLSRAGGGRGLTVERLCYLLLGACAPNHRVVLDNGKKPRLWYDPTTNRLIVSKKRQPPVVGAQFIDD